MTVSSEILDHVQTIESGAAAWSDHSHLSSVFKKAADELLDDDPRKQFLIWDIWLHDFQLSHQPPSEGLTPFFVMDGQCYPAPVEAFPNEAVEYYQERLLRAKHPSARARLADFLWLRTKKIGFADTAITAYLDAALVILPSTRGRSMSSEYLSRATHLILSLRKDPSGAIQAVRSLAGQFLTDEDGHLAHLISTTADLIDGDPQLSAWLVDEVSSLAARLASPGGQSRILERHLLEVLLPLKGVRTTSQAREFRLRIAKSWDDEASDRQSEGGLIHSALLQKAIKLYQDLGMGSDVDRLKPLLHEATRRADEGLHTVSTSVEIPVEEFHRQVDAYLERGRRRSPFFHLKLFAVHEGLWPAWSSIEKWTAELNQKAPLLALVSKVTISHDGRPYPRPSDPEKRREFDEIERYTQDLHMSLAFSYRKMHLLKQQDAWNEALILDALRDGALFDDEVLDAVRPGVQAFEAQRFWEAIHVLIPQIERVIRKLAESLGAQTHRYVPDTGEIHWTSLDRLLEEPKVIQTLALVRPDLAKELGYLLVDSRGWNLRNDVAHGILPASTDQAAIALLSMMMLLTLAMLVKQGRGDAKHPDESPDAQPGNPEVH